MTSRLYADFLASPWAAQVPVATNRLAEQLFGGFEGCAHGELKRWLAHLEALPTISRPRPALNQRAVTATGGTLDDRAVAALEGLSPWRKGPFRLHGTDIDTEWQSWMKWNRIAEAVDIFDATVLDVGCGNGYYGWRMLGAGARAVIGIDPTPLYVAQYHAVASLLPDLPNWVLPLGAEALTETGDFDRVFSMGVLYHQRSPLQHLIDLRRWVCKGGQVIVETLVVPGGDQTVLTPRDRYARMRNVWQIPSSAALTIWLSRAGFKDIRVVHEDATSTDEQRATPWMHFHSLVDFLDPEDHDRTVEGYPRPHRAIVVASRP